MRKITNVVGIILLMGVVVIYTIQSINVGTSPAGYFYTLETTYIKDYDQTESYSLNFYAYHLVDVQKINFTLESNDKTLSLQNVKIKRIGTCRYNSNLYNIYALEYRLSEYFMDSSAHLLINYEGEEYKLNLGYLSILPNKRQELSFQQLEGHYAKINDTLHLVGISVEFNEDIVISKASLNDNIYIQVQNIVINNGLESVISAPSIEDISEPSSGSKKLQAGTYYYFPLGYKKLTLVSQANIIVNDLYYLPGIPFSITTKTLVDYYQYVRKATYGN